MPVALIDQLTVELLFACLACQSRKLTSVLIDHRVANVALFDAFVLPVQVSLPQRYSVVESPVLMGQIDWQLLHDLASLQLSRNMLRCLDLYGTEGIVRWQTNRQLHLGLLEWISREDFTWLDQHLDAHVVFSVFVFARCQIGQVLLTQNRRHIILRDLLNHLSLSGVRRVPPFAHNCWNRPQALGVEECWISFVADRVVWKW